MDEDSSTEQKTWQIQFYSFRRSSVFRLHLNESRESFYWRRRGRSFHVDGLKRKRRGNQLVQGIWRLRVSEAECILYFSVVLSVVWLDNHVYVCW